MNRNKRFDSEYAAYKVSELVGPAPTHNLRERLARTGEGYAAGGRTGNSLSGGSNGVNLYQRMVAQPAEPDPVVPATDEPPRPAVLEPWNEYAEKYGDQKKAEPTPHAADFLVPVFPTFKERP